MLVIAVAFTSQAEANGAGNDNGVVFDISFDLPVTAAVVDNAAATVTPFANVTVEAVNNKNVGGFDVEVPSYSVVAVNNSDLTDGNKGFAETVSDLTSTDNGIDEYANTVKDNGIEFETDKEVFKYPIYPEYLANSTNSTKYTNERIKVNVGKFTRNI